eukprot:6456598-Amphidinium_carterae.2
MQMRSALVLRLCHEGQAHDLVADEVLRSSAAGTWCHVGTSCGSCGASSGCRNRSACAARSGSKFDVVTATCAVDVRLVNVGQQ